VSNLAAIIKDIVRRVAKREAKAENAATRQIVNKHRRMIAALKRQLIGQQRIINVLRNQNGQSGGATEDGDAKLRFSARSVRAQRKRLGLSAEDYGKLVGVSSLTIYNWEHGKARPRKAQFELLVAVRGIGKREAVQRLTGRSRKAR